MLSPLFFLLLRLPLSLLGVSKPKLKPRFLPQPLDLLFYKIYPLNILRHQVEYCFHSRFLESQKFSQFYQACQSNLQHKISQVILHVFFSTFMAFSNPKILWANLIQLITGNMNLYNCFVCLFFCELLQKPCNYRFYYNKQSYKIFVRHSFS